MPRQGCGHAIGQRCSRTPAEQFGGARIPRDKMWRITRPAVLIDRIGPAVALGPAGRQHLGHRMAVSRPQVEHMMARVSLEELERAQVCVAKITDMDVIANARSILR